MRVVEENAVLFTPVLKSFEVLPNAMTSVSYGSLRLSHQQLAFFIAQLAEGDGFPFAVDINHRAQLELETVVAGMGQIAQRINAFIQRTGGHFAAATDGCGYGPPGDFRFLMAP